MEGYPAPGHAPDAETQKQARRDFSRVGFSLLAMGAVTALVQLALALAAARIWRETAPPGWLLWFVTFAPQYLAAMPLAAWMLHRLVPASRPVQHPMGPGRFAAALLMCIGLMVTGSLLGSGLAEIFSGGAAENPLSAYVSRISALQVFVMVVLGPAAEELLFRKLLLDRLARYGGLPAALVSGLCFGLYHMNLFQFFYAAALGTLFAFLYLRTGRLRYPLALHMLVNLLGSVVGPLLLQAAGGAGQTGLVLLAAYELLLLGAAVAGLVLLVRARRQFTFPPAACQLPAGGCRVAVLNAGMLLFAALCLGLTVFTLFA